MVKLDDTCTLTMKKFDPRSSFRKTRSTTPSSFRWQMSRLDYFKLFVITISIKNNNPIIFALRVGFLHKTASKLVFTNYRYPQIWALKSLFKNNLFLFSPSLSSWKSFWVLYLEFSINLPMHGDWWVVLTFKKTSDTWHCTIKFISHWMTQSTFLNVRVFHNFKGGN